MRLRTDPGLVRYENLARDGQIAAYRVCKTRGKRPDDSHLPLISG